MAVQRSEHEKKFDRQMRLWGAHGQRNLEEGHVCVLGSNCAATETLKNLVLPNVGNFTVVDDAVVSARDCGNNFFVTQDDVGKKRADVVKEWLVEMNPDVSGTVVCKSVNEVVDGDLSFFDKFAVVIATQLYGKRHEKLAEYLYEKGIPYLSVRINGLLGSIRASLKELTIMESHPTNDRTDFYIYPKQLDNFPELRKFLESFDTHSDDIEKKAHCPCLAILAQFTSKWQSTHDGKLPETFPEQTEFKDAIREEYGDDENIDDAIHWAYQCYNPPRIDRDVQQVLDDPAAEKLAKDSSDFWVLVRALKDFMANEGKGFLPVSTNIPDFTSDPASYVTLKQLYKDRAARDLKLITGYAAKRLKDIGRDEKSIDPEIIDRFVKNCRALKVVRMRSVADEYKKPDMEFLEEQYMDMSWMEEKDDDGEEEAMPKPFDPKLVEWYWANRTCDAFYDKHSRLPGDTKENVENDAKELVELQKAMFGDIKLEQEVGPEVLAEIARFGGSEIHNTAAFIGGVASQVTMKLMLRQFFPFNHTFIHNAIYCKSGVFAV